MLEPLLTCSWPRIFFANIRTRVGKEFAESIVGSKDLTGVHVFSESWEMSAEMIAVELDLSIKLCDESQLGMNVFRWGWHGDTSVFSFCFEKVLTLKSCPFSFLRGQSRMKRRYAL